MHAQRRYLILQQQLIFQPCIFSSSANGRVLIGIYDVDYLTFALTKAELMDVDGRIKFEKTSMMREPLSDLLPLPIKPTAKTFWFIWTRIETVLLRNFNQVPICILRGRRGRKLPAGNSVYPPSALPIKHEFYPCAGYEQENGVNFYHGVC